MSVVVEGPLNAAESAELPFRQVAEHLATPCWISDAEGRIIWANDAWTEYTGMTPEAITRERGLHRIHDPEVYPIVRRLWVEAKAKGEPIEVTFPLLGQDGRFRPFLTRVTPLRDRRGRITRWFGVNTDISAQADAERGRRGAESRFRELFERAGEAIFVVSADGTLEEANGAASRLTGYDRRALLDLRPTDLFREFRLDAEASPETLPRQTAIRRRDGAWVEVEVNVAALSDGGCMALVRDITAQRESEARFRRQVGAQAAKAAEAERQLQRFWDASRDLLAIIANKDGKPRLLNRAAWEATLGYSGETLLQTRLVELAHPEDLQRTTALAAPLDAGRSVFGFENRYRHADGHWVWLSWNVVREGGLDYAIARDISQEVAAKAALAASERQFRLLVAGVVDYALFMLSPEGIVTNWNAGAERIKGYRANDILGRHFSVFYTEPDRAAGLPERALETARERGRYEAESWRVRKNGDLFWANVVIDAIHDETGELIGFAKITRDMTERREAQLELQRAQERLAQTQKLEAIGQLTGGVAHDFNNILMVVGGQTELLRRRVGGDDPAIARALDAIELSAARGRDLTRHLLAFARRQRLHPAPVAISSRADALRQLFAASVGSSITVEIDLPPDLWRIEVDISQLELALLNMAVNARDAMPNGGRITLMGRNVSLPVGALAEEPAGDYVALALRDTGAGIPPDILPKVFEPFFTTKDVDKGTGLGLSQVYGFVQQSGGRVGIDTELGQGTTITLYLPRIEAPPGAAERTTETATTPARAAYVLLVEDNPQVADVAARLLGQLGHRARCVASADAAVRLLDDGERPELLLSDIVMAGGRDGVDLAREVRRRWPDIPVLLATGYSEAAERMPHAEFPILPKPYGLAELGRALEAALAVTSGVRS